jgi:hypothetical protein
MKSLMILIVGVLGLACAGWQHIVITTSANLALPQVERQTGPSASRRLQEPKTGVVPESFWFIDFANMQYPTKYNGIVKLAAGKYEKPQIMGDTEIFLGGVNYVDLNGDGKAEAVVRLYQVICGGSCDGSSTLFYFFTMKHGKAVLLSRLETGSIAYTCGLKSFDLRGSELTLEAFRKCSLAGDYLKSTSDADRAGGKFVANEFTRFDLKFNGRRFVPLRRRVLPNPTSDIKNFPVSIRVSDG